MSINRKPRVRLANITVAIVKVTTAAVVENMSYFDCSHGQRHYPFGQQSLHFVWNCYTIIHVSDKSFVAGPGHTQELVDKYNMKNVFKLPISEHFSSSGDSGRCVYIRMEYGFALTCDLTLPWLQSLRFVRIVFGGSEDLRLASDHSKW